MKTTKRILSLFLCVVMILGMIPVIASAEETTATITFDDASKRTTLTTTQQVWEDNGITVTNNKASAQSNVADYAKPMRCYKGSDLLVEAPGQIAEIVFDCNGSYATALKNSIGTVSGATVTVSSDKVTVVFASAVENFKIAKLEKVFLDAITVTYTTAGSDSGETTDPDVGGGDVTEPDVGGDDDGEITNGKEVAVTYQFSVGTASNTALKADGLLPLFTQVDGLTLQSATPTNIYPGYPSTGAAFQGTDFLKTGTGSAVGKMVLVFDKDIIKVEIACHAWKDTSTDTVSVNDSAAQKAPVASVKTDVLTFDLSADPKNTVTINFNKRVFVFAITVTYKGEGSSEGGEEGGDTACQHTDLEVTYNDTEHTLTCSCGEYTVTEAHSLSDWTVKTPATYDAPGEEIKTCSRCAYTEKQPIPQKIADGNRFEKYTGDLVTGTYILIANGIALGEYKDGWILGTIAPVVAEDAVTDDEGGAWVLTVTNGYVKLKDANGKTVAPKNGDTNGITEGDYNWAVTPNEDGTYTFAGVSTDTTKLALYKNDGKFRALKNSTLEGSYAKDYDAKFVLYKKVNDDVCDCKINFTATATTHSGSCDLCGTVYAENDWHDMKGENGTCSICGETVDQAALTAAWLDLLFALESGASLDGDFRLTGTVTEINYAFDASYKNMSVTIAIEGEERTIYCYRMKCTADQAAAMYVGAVITVEGSFMNYFDEKTETNKYEILGSLISMVPCEHTYDNDCDADCNTCGATRDAGHDYDDNCDVDCNVCGDFRTAPHNLGESVPAVIPANCQETGHDEYWICADCGAYIGSNGSELNPAWINYNGEHVRPADAAACATVACELCGEDTYGDEQCDRGDAPACQDATCINCGGTVYGEGHSYGYDEETWEPLQPFCQPGDCIYCGEHLDYIYECENGSYAPCTVDGECSYGCGKQFPATGIHGLDDPCAGGTCWMCWNEIEGAHNYVDGACSNCGAADPDAGCGDNHSWNEGEVTVAAGKNTTGIMTYTCTACGEQKEEVIPPVLRFNGATLTLMSNVQVNFTVSRAILDEYGYTDLYAVFTYTNRDKQLITVTVTEYRLTDKYVFDFTELAPDLFGNTITATLYAKNNGKEYVSKTINYSVLQYCNNQLKVYAAAVQKADLCFRTMLVDLLNYGAAAQLESGNNTDALVNAGLTEEQKSWGSTASGGYVSIQGAGDEVETPRATWKSASLLLEDAVTMVVTLEAADLEGLSVKVNCGKFEFTYDCVVDPEAEEQIFVPGERENRYKLYINELPVYAMRDPVYITVYKDGEAASRQLTYSVESYVANKYGEVSESFDNMLDAMMCYGDAVNAYVTALGVK